MMSPADRLPGALDAPCAVSYGPVPGSVNAGHRFLDVLSHGRDLAVATGQEYALDSELMPACQQITEPQLDAFRNSGALAPSVAVPADASAQTRTVPRPRPVRHAAPFTVRAKTRQLGMTLRHEQPAIGS